MRFYAEGSQEFTTADYVRELEKAKAVTGVRRIAGKVDYAKNTQGIPQPDLYVELAITDSKSYSQADVDAFFAQPEVQAKLQEAFRIQVELMHDMDRRFGIDNLMEPFEMAIIYDEFTKSGG